MCRREEQRAAAEAEAQEKARQRHQAYLRRLGWRGDRPPLDHKMRAAGERPDDD